MVENGGRQTSKLAIRARCLPENAETRETAPRPCVAPDFSLSPPGDPTDRTRPSLSTIVRGHHPSADSIPANPDDRDSASPKSPLSFLGPIAATTGKKRRF
jgi:hypothetical protein